MMRLWNVVILVLGLVVSSARAGVVKTSDGEYSGAIRIRGEQIGIEQDNQTRWFPFSKLVSADFKAGSGGKAQAGRGLRGEYFAGRNFQKLMLIRNDPAIDYRWTETLPHPSLCPTGREFSVRWTGRLRPDRTEKFQIISTADDGVRIWLDNKLIVDRWWDQSANDYAADVALEAGRDYELKVEYFNGQDIALARLSWASPSIPRRVIGPENLLLPPGEEDPAKGRGLVLQANATDGGPNFVRLIGSDGTGLRAEYYTDRDLSQLAFIRFDPNIDAHYYDNEHVPDPTMAPEGSVRWTGMLEPRFTEAYRFHVEAHRRVKLWVDGKLIVDKWNTEGGEFSSDPIELTAGKKVPFRVDFSSSTGFMLCRVRWSSLSTPRDVIPPSLFSSPPGQKLSRPSVGLVFPATDVVLIAPPEISLKAIGMSPNAPVQHVEFFERTTKIHGSATAQPYHLGWPRPDRGVFSIRARLTDTLGVTALSDASTLTVTGRGDGSLKAPWGDFYITNNEHITMGVASMRDNRIHIDKATGTLLSNGDHDAGHFVVQALNGDGQIVARLAGMAPKDPSAMAMAGITLRQNMRHRCKQVTLAAGVSPAGESGVHFIRRQENWSNPISTEKRMDVPCWLKLLRHGGRVYAYVSNDGKSWELLGTERFDTGPLVMAGLVATAESKANPASAVFEEVNVKPGSPELMYSEKGFVTRAGTFIAADVHTIDQNLLRFSRNGREESAPLNEVGRIVYKPLLTDHGAKIQPGTVGLMMTSGDFFEGDVKSLSGGRVEVSSILFGLRRVSIADDVTAIILRDVEPQKAPFLVATTDQSIYRARSISSEGSDVIIQDVSLGRVALPMGLLANIRVP